MATESKSNIQDNVQNTNILTGENSGHFEWFARGDPSNSKILIVVILNGLATGILVIVVILNGLPTGIVSTDDA